MEKHKLCCSSHDPPNDLAYLFITKHLPYRGAFLVKQTCFWWYSLVCAAQPPVGFQVLWALVSSEGCATMWGLRQRAPSQSSIQDINLQTSVFLCLWVLFSSPPIWYIDWKWFRLCSQVPCSDNLTPTPHPTPPAPCSPLSGSDKSSF